jgi:hypothetical protein
MSAKSTRLTIECHPELVRRAKVLAAVRGVTLRDLITNLINEAALSGEVPGTKPTMSHDTGTPTTTPDPATEYAVLAYLEGVNRRGEEEHARRVRAGIIKD